MYVFWVANRDKMAVAEQTVIQYGTSSSILFLVTVYMGWGAFKRPFPLLHAIASRVRPVMHETFVFAVVIG